MKILENKTEKRLVSKDVNYYFNKETGLMMTWGKTTEEDPDFSPYGPFIADIEVSTICKGPGGKLCPYCYKNSTTKGEYMTLETFKKVFHKLPKVLTQIAFGADAQCTSNPELFDIMQYTRDNGVIPNITVADISDEVADKLAKVCGAVAVSFHGNKDLCYDSIKKLTDRGMTQVNIHQVIMGSNYDQVIDTIKDIQTDSRLEKLNAIVFLSLKQKGRGIKYKPLTSDQFTSIIDLCLSNDIRLGMDSCLATRFLKYLSDHNLTEKYSSYVEPCESFGLFSSYINVKGNYFPCSFAEGTPEWENGLSVLDCNNFIKDIWFSPLVNKYREMSLNCKRSCLLYNI